MVGRVMRLSLMAGTSIMDIVVTAPKPTTPQLADLPKDEPQRMEYPEGWKCKNIDSRTFFRSNSGTWIQGL